MSRQKRIVCYAINGAGLGHVTRLLSVAKWMRRYVALLEGRPAEIIFLTSSDASDVLADADIAAFKIPSKTVAKKTLLNKLEYRRLAKHFVWNTLGVFSPDLLVVDTFPSGSFDELFQMLDGPFKKSFIYRAVKPEYAARATFRSAASMYDVVVAPHSEQSCPAEQIGNQKIRCSGEVLQYDRDDFLPRDVVREQLGIAPTDRLVYVSAGGGGDPGVEDQLRSIIAAVSGIPNVHLLVGAGPLYRGNRISAPNLTWFTGPGVGQYFGGVDAAICAAGYNTFHELLLAGVPTAFFAQSKIADDQSARISSAAHHGACRKIESVDDADALIRSVHELLDESAGKEIAVKATELVSGNGAARCALELLSPLYDSDRLKWADCVLTSRLAKRLETVVGSTAAISDWLRPLVPQDRVRSIVDLSAIDGVAGQLSDSAAAELRSVLDTLNEDGDYGMFESELVGLLDRIEDTDSAQRSAFTGDVLKTIVATMKKNPLPATQSWTAWVCEIVRSVSDLLELQAQGDEASASDPSLMEMLQLYRVFPKIADASVADSFALFQRKIQSQRDAGEPAHRISQSFQLLKMTHQKVTREILEQSLHNPITQADLHG